MEKLQNPYLGKLKTREIINHIHVFPNADLPLVNCQICYPERWFK
jgi:hypothetical protein